MEIVKGLIKLAKKNSGIYSPEKLWDFSIYSSNPAARLMEIILNKEGISEAEAMRALYGQRNKVAFDKAKSRLTEDLISFFCGINCQQLKKKQEGYYHKITLFHKWQVMKLLQLNGLHEGGSKLALNLIKTIKQLKIQDVNNILIDCEEYRNYFFYQVHPDSKKFNESNANYKDLLNEYFIEKQGLNTFRESLFPFQYKMEPDTLIKENLRKGAEKIQELNSNLKNHRLEYLKYKLFCTYYMTVKDFEKHLKLAEEAALFFKNTSYRSGFARGEFLREQITVMIHLKKFEEAENLIPQTEKIYSAGKTQGLLNLQMCKVLLYLHKAEAIKAADIIDATSDHNLTAETYPQKMAFHYLLSGYVQILLQSQCPDIIAVDSYPLIKKFKINDYQIKGTNIKTDKPGMHLSYLLLRNLFRVVDNRKDAIIGDIEALDKFMRRYNIIQNDAKLYKFHTLVKAYLTGESKREQLKTRFDKDYHELVNLRGHHISSMYFYEILPLEKQWEIFLFGDHKM